MERHHPAPADGDTIAAVATATGRGGIGVVRVSGPASTRIATELLGSIPRPRHASLRSFRDAAGQAIDEGIALFFPGPDSFTGEDVLELQGHGSPVVLDLLLARLLELGARHARPGEFSERAFLNGRMDLAQAEAVADLIASGSAGAARAALRSMQGEFSRQVRTLVTQLVALRVQVEAEIDFPDEDIDLPVAQQLQHDGQKIRAAIAALLAPARQGCLLQEGVTVVLAGLPNSGKSSLLNALAGHDRAIVSRIPGTTRDLLREQIEIDGLPVLLIDTAGLRESDDEIEREGVRRARAAMDEADHVLLLADDSAAADPAALTALLPPAVPRTLVRSKIDLSGRAPGAAAEGAGITEVAVSALTGAGIDALRRHLARCAGVEGGGPVFSARRRHLDALGRADRLIDAAVLQLARHQIELAAEELRLAQQALDEITGAFTTEDLLAEIFSGFCIGK
ncbi:MAG: tRNA uridine-5-carboxymethylaminomethyl(34) synthesis GTPase MnmE [Pseudomonadota bacterium]|nr:tRNA uridine-5-carboxymethylaminomethyl(34) synthesis GTPase MnmE [Pseudomonadota bacterium]